MCFDELAANLDKIDEIIPQWVEKSRLRPAELRRTAVSLHWNCGPAPSTLWSRSVDTAVPLHRHCGLVLSTLRSRSIRTVVEGERALTRRPHHHVLMCIEHPLVGKVQLAGNCTLGCHSLHTTQPGCATLPFHCTPIHGDALCAMPLHTFFFRVQQIEEISAHKATCCVNM